MTAGRVARLVERFDAIARTRMAGVPILHPGLRVEAVGFAPAGEGDGAVLVGVLVTPWSMNLLRLPLGAGPVAAAGVSCWRALGDGEIEFLGAHDEVLGAYEQCSLFSPMGGFRDAAHARETAEAVLAMLRPAPSHLPDGLPEPAPARRAFLFGRGAAARA